MEQDKGICTNIILTENIVHPWIRAEHICMRGWFFWKDEFYSGENLRIFYQLYKEVGFEKVLHSIRGNYAVIIDEGTFLLASVDRISSYPLFYSEDKNGITVSDSILKIRDVRSEVHFGNGFHSFEATGFAVGRLTILDNVYRIQSGEFIKYEKESRTLKRYNWFMHIHKGREIIKSSESMLKDLDTVVFNMFHRMIRSINGKTVVVFLSGGYDSRLVVVSLKRLGYENVVCLSWGDERDLNTKVAKQVAENLGYPWKMIKTDKAFWRKKRKDGVIDQMLDLSDRSLDFMPFLQAPVIQEALRCEYIPQDSVIVTGQSGDAIEGEDVSHYFNAGENYSVADVIQPILHRHYNMQGKNAWKDNTLYEEIDEEIRSYVPNTSYDEALAEDVVECFNWRERQTKYVINEVRNCDDYCHLEWRLPLWDEEFVDFWLSVPYEWRKDRKLYYQYIKGECLPTANVVSYYQIMKNRFKMLFPRLSMLGYFIKGLYDYFVTEKSYFAPLGGIRFSEYLEVFKYTKGFRNNPMMCYLYLMKKKLKEKIQ